jgi:cysteine-rich repeat protein
MDTRSTPRWWFAFSASLLLGVLLGACFEPATVTCNTGLICPPGTICSNDGASCTEPGGCGNNVIDPGEACDDGNQTDGDGCSANCLSKEVCGNRIIDFKFGPNDARNEVCDDGNVDGGDGCSANCKSNETCGNRVLDYLVGEVCDDGNTVDGDGCAGNCRSTEYCGNHVVDNRYGPNDPRNEECDDGNTTSGDGCSATCKAEGCGNGILDTSVGEVCDDHNRIDGDGCSADCRSNETCGNHTTDNKFGPGDPRNEVCDDGNRVGGDGCSADCKSDETCGNGIVDRAVPMDGGTPEVCDDGNRDAGDGCSANCRSTEACGNGILDVAVGEVCDDGNRTGGDGCSADCRSDETCGNRILDRLVKRDGGLEQCDEGAAGSARCSPSCLLRYCGNGIVDPGEVCDDGNQVSGDGCEPTCMSTGGCGNGKVDVGEQCDDGNTTTSDSCIACRLAFCGDGWTRAPFPGDAGEQCDTGGMSTICNANCTFPRCGDGIVNPFRGEQCDVAGSGGIGPDGGLLGGESATCDRDCTAAFCGDGVTNATRGEACDDGNASNNDGCLNTCVLSSCGDGFINAATETCDDGAALNGSVCPYGTPSCSPCAADCKSRPTLTGAYCGDGIPQADAGELCDDGNAAACGTCSADCRGAQPLAAAAGRLVAVKPSTLGLDEYFVLDDGANPPVSFQFDLGGVTPPVRPGRVPVDATPTFQDGGARTADDLAGSIAASIVLVGPTLNLSAVAGPDGGVALTNKASGGFGNRPILTSPAPAWQVTGMAGGGGKDCAQGVGCRSDADCQGLLTCKPPAGTVRTCQP